MVPKLIRFRNFPSSYGFAPTCPRAYLGVSRIILVIGFWPEQKEKRKTLIARFPKTKEESIQFPFTENFEGFARVKNSVGFLNIFFCFSIQ
uniref:Uncharacterized protein n=1 Tax=Meloidogyne incognita TaxID=6306 RepID=A0A914MBL4_MELIC